MTLDDITYKPDGPLSIYDIHDGETYMLKSDGKVNGYIKVSGANYYYSTDGTPNCNILSNYTVSGLMAVYDIYNIQ